ncbi:MAG: hypothetical protein Kow0029_11660 [Candidatus Rifleibacteriota bacterium]
MEPLSQAHPFLVREWGLNILEVINIDTEIDASHKALGVMFILSKRFSNLVFTLPPHCNLSHDVGPQLKELAKKVNLKLVFLSNDQVPFSLDFVETFNSSEDAVLRLKSSIIFKKIAKDFADVTPFKSSALSLLGMLNEPDISFAKIENAVTHEPLLVARILQTANSAFFMRRNKVEDIGQAIAYLGIEGFKQVLVQMIFQNLATKYFAHQEQRLRHSEAVSHLAVKLAERKIRDQIILGKVRVAGLLHDIGALAIQYCFPDEYQKVSEIIEREKVTVNMAEQRVFGLDHCEVGSKLCFEWGLPAFLMDCAKYHHMPVCSNNANIIEPVIVANSFMNVEVEQLPSLDYTRLLSKFAIGNFENENEAKLEVQAFLYSTWKSFKESLERLP